MILGADLLVQMILMGFAAPGLWTTLIPLFYHNILITFSFCCLFTEIFWPFLFPVFMQYCICFMLFTLHCSHAIYIYFLSIYLRVVKLFIIRFPICLSSSVKRRLVLERLCKKKKTIIFMATALRQEIAGNLCVPYEPCKLLGLVSNVHFLFVYSHPGLI